jgi:hypothetical protein
VAASPPPPPPPSEPPPAEPPPPEPPARAPEPEPAPLPAAAAAATAAVPAAAAAPGPAPGALEPERQGRWSRRRALPLTAGAVVAAGGAVLAVVLLGGGSSPSPTKATVAPAPTGERIAGALGPVPTNHVTGDGKAVVRLNGNAATVTLDAGGLLDAAHPLHIHAGGKGICPPASAAHDHNGHQAISTLDGVPYYGPPVTALTTRGKTNQQSILALRRFPTTGTIRYRRTFTLPKAVAAYVREGDAVIVVHGADYNHNGIYDNVLDRSDLNRALPGELTTPALCGALVPAKATKKPSGSGSGSTASSGRVFTASLHVPDQGPPAPGRSLLCPLHDVAEATVGRAVT